MLDKYISGYSDRISPEAPVQIIKAVNESIFLGGAGNVVANLSGLGACVYPIGVIGNDKPGRTIISMLKIIKIISDYISENNKSTLKTRIVVNNQQLLRVDWDQDVIL
jgi:bifunctional ADP-heptose synthase (sugar kinase/adenylyltransferase)